MVFVCSRGFHVIPCRTTYSADLRGGTQPKREMIRPKASDTHTNEPFKGETEKQSTYVAHV